MTYGVRGGGGVGVLRAGGGLRGEGAEFEGGETERGGGGGGSIGGEIEGGGGDGDRRERGVFDGGGEGVRGDEIEGGHGCHFGKRSGIELGEGRVEEEEEGDGRRERRGRERGRNRRSLKEPRGYGEMQGWEILRRRVGVERILHNQVKLCCSPRGKGF